MARNVTFIIFLILVKTRTVFGQSCNQADAVFLIDESGSIGADNWAPLLRFVVNVVNKFQVGPDDMQFAALKYSTETTVEFKLNTYSNKQGIIDHVNRLTYGTGGTTISKAIGTARSTIFSGRTSDGDRPNAPDVIILITDGKPSSADTSRTMTQGALAKAEGIHIVSVGIADGINEDLLRDLSSTGILLSASDFSELDSLITGLSRVVCLASQNGAPGSTGPRGATGSTGPQGSIGSTGPRGLPGPPDLSSCLADNGGCEHSCAETSNGVRCDCDAGYELTKNNRTCQKQGIDLPLIVMIVLGVCVLVIISLVVAVVLMFFKTNSKKPTPVAPIDNKDEHILY